jgi:transposase
MIKEQYQEKFENEKELEIATTNNINMLKNKRKRHRKIKIADKLFKKEIKAKTKHDCDILVSKHRLSRHYDKSTAPTDNINQQDLEESSNEAELQFENTNEVLLKTSEDFLNEVQAQEIEVKKMFFSSKLKYLKKHKLLEILKNKYDIREVSPNLEGYILIFLIDQLEKLKNLSKSFTPFTKYLLDFIYSKKKPVIKDMSELCLNHIPKTVKGVSEKIYNRIKNILYDSNKFVRFFLNEEVLKIIKDIYSQTKSELKESSIEKKKEIKSSKKNAICGAVHVEKDFNYVKKEIKNKTPVTIDPYYVQKCGASYLLKSENMPVLEISKKLDVPLSLVEYWQKKLLKDGTLFKRSIVPGRTKKVSEDIIEKIRDFTFQQTSDNLVKDIKEMLQEKYSTRVGNMTVYRILKTLGKFNILKEVPVLSDINKQKRLMYCNKMLCKSFKKIVFSDECLLVGRGRKRVIFHPDGAIMRKKIWSTQPFSIMVWGCICSKGKIALKIYHLGKIIDHVAYMETLTETIPVINETLGENWYFVQDNARPHVSLTKSEFFTKNNLNLLDHPPQSPDLNPIEQIWNQLKSKVDKMNYSTMDQYIGNVIRAWNSIPDESCTAHIKNLRKVMLDVKRNDGSNIFNSKLRKEKLMKKNYKEDFDYYNMHDDNFVLKEKKKHKCK